MQKSILVANVKFGRSCLEQIFIVLFILISMHRPFNYHAIEILSS